MPGRVAAIEETAPLLRSLRDPLARDLYIDKLAQLLRVDVGLVQRALRAPQNIGFQQRTANQPSRFDAAPRSNGSAARLEFASGGAPAAVATMLPPSEPHPDDYGDAIEPEADGPAVVVQRPLSRTHAALLAFLAQHGDLLPRVDLSYLKDDAVRALVASAQERQKFDAALLSTCAPEIRDAVARALSSEEFAGDSAKKAFEPIIASMRLPTDLPALMHERTVALERGDRDLVETLNARINAVRRSSR